MFLIHDVLTNYLIFPPHSFKATTQVYLYSLENYSKISVIRHKSGMGDAEYLKMLVT